MSLLRGAPEITPLPAVSSPQTTTEPFSFKAITCPQPAATCNTPLVGRSGPLSLVATRFVAVLSKAQTVGTPPWRATAKDSFGDATTWSTPLRRDSGICNGSPEETQPQPNTRPVTPFVRKELAELGSVPAAISSPSVNPSSSVSGSVTTTQFVIVPTE